MTAGAQLEAARGDTRSPVSRNVSRRAKHATGRIERWCSQRWSALLGYLSSDCSRACAGRYR